MIRGDFHFEFYVLCIVVLWLALRGILSGQGVFEFPTVAAMMGLAWVIPQGIELESNAYNPYSSGAFWLYVTACFLLISWCFQIGRNSRTRQIHETRGAALPNYDVQRLLMSAGGLAAVGQLSILLMGGIDTSGMGGQWTGVITFYALLAGANSLALCLAALVYVRTRSTIALCIGSVAAMPLFWAAFSGVRREQMFDLLVLPIGSWYLARRSYPPRFAVITCLLLGTLVLNKIEDLRNHVRSGGSVIELLLSEKFYTSFNYFDLGQGQASEVGLAQHDFAYMNRTDRWEYGADYWNLLVHQYVPAFLIGREAKESLKIDSLSQRLLLGQEEGAFSLGSTRTGFSDTYRSFAFFGIIVFGAIGYVFGCLYARSTVGGLAGQYFYLVLLAEGLKSITHGTAAFVSALPFVVIVSLAALRFAEAPSDLRAARDRRTHFSTKSGSNPARRFRRTILPPAKGGY